MKGSLLIAIGSLITLGVLSTGTPSGTYAAAWAAILVGGFFIVRGLREKTAIAGYARSSIGWIVVSVLFVGLVGGSSLLAFSGPFGPEQLEPPSDSSVSWTDDGAVQSAQGSTTFSGTVRNLDSSWLMNNARVRLTLEDSAGQAVDTFDILLNPISIEPNSLGTYLTTRIEPTTIRSYTGELLWEWAHR
jgi:hypothetical protein